MCPTKKLVVVAAVLAFALPSCRFHRTSGGSKFEAPVGSATASPDARAVERQIAHLRALLAVEGQSVKLAEQQLTQTRYLFEAGRVALPEVQAAEQELLDRKKTLLDREQQLADVRMAATKGR